MFRNFYAEQDMTDPRDSWYKPNMLYNIHYRPPKPPRMIVVKKKFNPSVCTCGEHGCKPHYRMEREVVFPTKEVNSKDEKERLREKIQDKRNVTTEIEYDASSEDDEDSGKENDCADENVEEWKSDLYEAPRCEFNATASEKGIHDDNAIADGSSNGEMMADKKTDDAKLGHNVGTEGASHAGMSRFDIELPDGPDFDAPDVTENSVNLDEDLEECGSAFGIMRVYCESELHVTWNGKNMSSIQSLDEVF